MAAVNLHNFSAGNRYSSLLTDHIVEVYVGTINPDSKPYRVQQVTLESATNYLTKTLEKDTFKEGSKGRLHFPDDNEEAWEVPLFWMIKHTMPVLFDGESSEVILVTCWALGDKYSIPAFQDEAMLQLLRLCEPDVLSKAAAAKALEMSAPGSKMRQLLAGELVTAVPDIQQMDYVEAEAVIDGTGILAKHLSALARFQKEHAVFGSRFEDAEDCEA